MRPAELQAHFGDGAQAGALGADEEGYRSEFVQLVKAASSLDGAGGVSRK